MNDLELRSLRQQAVANALIKTMDEEIGKSQSYEEITDVLIAWAQVLGATVGAMEGTTYTKFQRFLELCNNHTEAAYIMQVAAQSGNDKDD